MNRTIHIMELALHILDDAALEKKVREYLQDEHLNVILLASQELLLQADSSPELKEALSRADLILPGEEGLLSLYPGELPQGEGLVVNYHCLERLLVKLQGEKKTLYAVLENEAHLRAIEKLLESGQFNMVLLGSALKPEMTDESIVNEINSLAPDILLIDLQVPMQEEWILAHSTQLNSRLCIGLGGIMEQMLAEYKKEPALISRLHLSGLYNSLIRRSHYKRAQYERGLQKRLREYGEKRKENKDENTGK